MFISYKRNIFYHLRITAIISLLLAPGFACAEDDFGSGKMRVSVSASTSTAFNDNYFQLGLGVGYYLWDGLELGLDARSWLGGEIDIHEVSPSLTYVFTNLQSFKPYGGLLYRRTFLEGRDDLSAYGARGGIFVEQSQNLLLRAGFAAIRYQNCERAIYSDCTEIYPEISAGIYF